MPNRSQRPEKRRENGEESAFPRLRQTADSSPDEARLRNDKTS